MGFTSPWHWLIVLLIVVLVFGTKKLKSLGSDLGGAVKGFKDGLKDASAENPPAQIPNQNQTTTQNAATQNTTAQNQNSQG